MLRGTDREGRAAGKPRAPTGTVTFLFSDIERSSQRWEAYPDGMRHAVARHDELMRDVIERSNGLVFKTVGDEFCSTFASAADALTAAVSAQNVLASEDFSAVDGLRVRIALHTGYAEERDGDYFGPTVNRVARLMATGAGGQILLSGVTYDLVQAAPISGVTFTDLGVHRLKDLAHPERVWQVIAPGLATDFPPLRSLDTLPNNLPMQVTAFFGREHDVKELKEQISQHRLLTLFGAGGVGKTRLALQVAAEVLDHYPDGVWFTDLSLTQDPELVSSLVARAVGMAQSQTQSLDEVLPQWLRAKKALLILDCCEHLLGRVATLVDAIHRQCPEVRLLITSRQALGLSGEKVHRVASLSVPTTMASLTAVDALKFGAVALFVDRAALVNESFRLSDDNALFVADICQRLDGIPLALELAAARLRVLSIRDLAHRLHERFKILTQGSRTALPRQKTLAALIDWSYDLLTAEERTLFNRLAIFAGGFSMDDATEVCAGGSVASHEILDLLTSLAEKSLVVVDSGSEDASYRLLESTREYAWEKLVASGDSEQLARAHASHFARLANTAQSQFGKVPLSEWLRRIEPNLQNLRAVLSWTLSEHNDPALGGALAAALEMFWWHGGLEREGRRWIGLALSEVDEDKHRDIVSQLRRAQALLTSRVLFS